MRGINSSCLNESVMKHREHGTMDSLQSERAGRGTGRRDGPEGGGTSGGRASVREDVVGWQ